MTCSARRSQSCGQDVRVAFPRRERGGATLFMTTVVMFLITVVTIYANKGGVFEQKISGNHYAATQAFKAAQAGVDYSVAWLSTAGNPTSTAWATPVGTTGAAWVSDASYPPYNQKNTTSIAARTIGNYTVSTVLWRHSDNAKLIEIVSTSTGDATSTIRQIVNVTTLSFGVSTVSPLIVNGSISGVTGNPEIVGEDADGNSIISSSNNIDTGNLSFTGDVETPDSFTSNAWDYLFGMSKSDMALMAQSQSGGATGGPIHYYNDATVNTYSPANLGTSSSPVLLIFDISSGDCPKISGGKTIYGIVYCGRGFDMNGWGGTTIHGSLVLDTDLTKFTANTNLAFHATANNPASYGGATPLVSRIIGTWRDF